MTDPVIDSIKRLDFDYQIIDCDPELADTAAFCASYGYQPSESANAILVVGKGDPRVYALCVVLADTQIDVNKTVRHKFGRKKASFASSDETKELTGMILGGVTPFGTPESIPVWIDSRVLLCPKVIVGGGSRDRKIYISPKALSALPSAEVVDDLAKERSEA